MIRARRPRSRRRHDRVAGLGARAALVVALGACAPAPAPEPVRDMVDLPRASSSARLAALPDGEERRRFILDCTGCHTLREELAYPGGVPRTRDAWRSATASMVARFGPTTGFPVIGPDRDPERTAEWLASSLPPTPPPPQQVPAALVGRADIREYLLPEPADLPHDVAVADGRVLATGMFTGRMYRVDPATGAVETEATPAPNPRAVEVGPDGSWWVVLGGPEKVARRTPDGEWHTFDAGFYAHSVALTPDGAVWVNGHFTHDPERIRRIDPTTGASREFTVPRHPDFATTPIPYEIRAAADGTLWMSELLGNRLVRLDPATGAVRTWSLPTPWSGPRRLDVDPDGTVWIPEYAANRLARFDPATGSFKEYDLPIEAAAPYVVRHDPRRGVLWIGTGAADAVLRFDPATERFTVYPLPSPDQLVRHLVVDSVTGDVWLAPGASPGSAPARLVRLRPRPSPPRPQDAGPAEFHVRFPVDGSSIPRPDCTHDPSHRRGRRAARHAAPRPPQGIRDVEGRDGARRLL